MWGKYHQLCTSDAFQKLWENFLKVSQIDYNSDPIFYQYITTYMFGELIKKQFPAPSLLDSCNMQQYLTYEEKNALYYVAGYIPRALRKQLERSKHELKEELILCLHELTEDDGIDDESQDWIKKIDRGGLKHANFTLCSLIVAMVQAILQQATYHSRKIKENAIAGIMENDEVKYHWDAVSVKWEAEEEEGKALFPMITEMWMKMRGFAYVSAWVEQCKQETKISTQKSKGNRKHLL